MGRQEAQVLLVPGTSKVAEADLDEMVDQALLVNEEPRVHQVLLVNSSLHVTPEIALSASQVMLAKADEQANQAEPVPPVSKVLSVQPVYKDNSATRKPLAEMPVLLVSKAQQANAVQPASPVPPVQMVSVVLEEPTEFQAMPVVLAMLALVARPVHKVQMDLTPLRRLSPILQV